MPSRFLETGRWPGRETLGTATTSADITMDDPQPSPTGSLMFINKQSLSMDAVHRLNGSGFMTSANSSTLLAVHSITPAATLPSSGTLARGRR